MYLRKALLVAGGLLACLTVPAQAGRSCEERALTPEVFRQAMVTAE